MTVTEQTLRAQNTIGQNTMRGGGMETHTVTVNADGSFSPMWLDIHGDDLVEWQFHDRRDTVMPARWDGPFPAICSAATPYDPSDVNDFTGPMPVAPSGIFA